MDETIIWKLARQSVLRVLKAEHRGFLYNLLVFLQCARYLCRFAIIRLLSVSPYLDITIRRLKRKAICSALDETKMIALVRDLGVHPKSVGPLESLKAHAVFEMIVDILASDDTIDRHTIEMLSQKLVAGGFDTIQEHWVVTKIKAMAQSLPASLFSEGFYSKVIRTTVGVVGYCLHKNKDFPIEKALAMGFNFGTLYLYDEAQDVPGLVSETEMRWIEKRIAILLNDSKTTLEEPPGSVSRWLHESATDLEILCPKTEFQDFYTCLRILAQVQKLEITDPGSNVEYTYTLLALKSAMTRLIPATLAQWDIDERYITYTMVTGIANQLIDDLRDFPEDYNRKIPTPYVRYFSNRAGFPHPFSVYLRAIESSIHFLPRHQFLARILWSIRLTHGMRVLALKLKRSSSPFPLGPLWKQYVFVSGLCHHEIIDIEATLARLATQLISLSEQREATTIISH